MIDEEYEIMPTDEYNKLTEWDNEPTVDDLKRDYKEAKPFYDDHRMDVDKWMDNLNMTGQAKPKSKSNRSSVAPKLIRKQAEWRYAALTEPFLSTDDLFNTEPETYEDKKAAEQAGLVLNYQFNTQIPKVKFIDEYIRTAVDEGTVIVRTGWEFEEEEQEVEVPIYSMMPVGNPEKAQAMIQQGIPPVEQVQTGSTMELQMVTTKNKPVITVCNYKHILVDPTCEGDIDKAKFIIYSFETSMSELKKDGRYSNLDQIDLNDSSILNSPDDETEDTDLPRFKFKDKPRKKFWAHEYWGYWDIDNSGVVKPIVATYAGNTMIRVEENPMPDKKLPFVFAQYLPVRKSPWGQPDGELLEDNQKIIGAITRGMIDIMGRSANGQMGVLKGVLDPANKRKFDKGADYEFNPGNTPDKSFYMHKFDAIPQSAEFLLSQQNVEAESLTGVKAFYQGISSQSLGATATGVRSAMDAASKRELGILRRLAQGIKEIGRKIMAMNSEFLTEEEVIRVTNEEFIAVSKDDLQGNYDIRLKISTAEADNEKAQELSFMLQTMGNNMDPSMSKMILADIAKLRKMPDLAKRIEEYKPQPDPLARKRAQLEVDLLEAQIMNERARSQENAADIDLKKQKTVTEAAKGRNLHSIADKTDLDFLEKDAGISHQRELDLKEHDRLSKLDQEAAKAMLAPKQSNTSI